MTVADTPILASSGASVRDYVSLLKPRVMSLVLFTAFVGLVVAPGHLSPVLAVASLIAIAAGAGGSAALNMWFDADIDARMARTANRAVPSGRVAPGDAAALGLALSLFSVLALALAAGYLAAALLAFTIFFYAVVYTMGLKRRTPQNIVIGGAAGALPPVIGWAAATGAAPTEAWILFLLIFLWTPAHFWALALLKTEDYARAGIPMMPNVMGERATRTRIFVYAVLTVAASTLPVVTGFAGAIYAGVAALMGLVFLVAAGRVSAARSDSYTGPARAMFGVSILYLFLLFAALLADRVIGTAVLHG